MLTMPTYKRAYPDLFKGKTVRDGLVLFDQGYRTDTTYGGVSPASLLEPTRALIHRTGSPLPCEYFVGVIKGLLGLFSIEGTAREVQCQWMAHPLAASSHGGRNSPTAAVIERIGRQQRI